MDICELRGTPRNADRIDATNTVAIIERSFECVTAVRTGPHLLQNLTRLFGGKHRKQAPCSNLIQPTHSPPTDSRQVPQMRTPNTYRSHPYLDYELGLNSS